MAILQVEDPSGDVEVVVFPQTYREQSHLLTEEAVVLVRGESEVRDDGVSVRADEIIPIAEAYARLGKGIDVAFPVEETNEDDIFRFKDLVSRYRGTVPISLVFLSDRVRWDLRPERGFGVQPSAEMLEELRAHGRQPAHQRASRLMPPRRFELDLEWVQKQLANLQATLTDRAAQRGFEPPRIVVVSKYLTADDARRLRAAGVTPLGENRANDLIEKTATDTPQQATDWHFIGHLQRNKIGKVLPRVGLLHSLDSERLAESIEANGVNESSDRCRHSCKSTLPVKNRKGASPRRGAPLDPPLARAIRAHPDQWSDDDGATRSSGGVSTSVRSTARVARRTAKRAGATPATIGSPRRAVDGHVERCRDCSGRRSHLGPGRKPSVRETAVRHRVVGNAGSSHRG